MSKGLTSVHHNGFFAQLVDEGLLKLTRRNGFCLSLLSYRISYPLFRGGCIFVMQPGVRKMPTWARGSFTASLILGNKTVFLNEEPNRFSQGQGLNARLYNHPLNQIAKLSI